MKPPGKQISKNPGDVEARTLPFNARILNVTVRKLRELKAEFAGEVSIEVEASRLF